MPDITHTPTRTNTQTHIMEALALELGETPKYTCSSTLYTPRYTHRNRQIGAVYHFEHFFLVQKVDETICSDNFDQNINHRFVCVCVCVCAFFKTILTERLIIGLRVRVCARAHVCVFVCFHTHCVCMCVRLRLETFCQNRSTRNLYLFQQRRSRDSWILLVRACVCVVRIQCALQIHN